MHFCFCYWFPQSCARTTFRLDGTSRTDDGITTVLCAAQRCVLPFFCLLLMPLQRVSKMCITPPTDYAVQSAALIIELAEVLHAFFYKSHRIYT